MGIWSLRIGGLTRVSMAIRSDRLDGSLAKRLLAGCPWELEQFPTEPKH
jgi:hypothetical protein